MPDLTCLEARSTTCLILPALSDTVGSEGVLTKLLTKLTTARRLKGISYMASIIKDVAVCNPSKVIYEEAEREGCGLIQA